ncbi:MAG: histidine kinase [Nocardioides sp.]
MRHLDREWGRQWLPQIAIAVVIAALGVAEAVTTPINYGDGGRSTLVLVALATAVAVAASRHAPAVALALVWLTGLVQVGVGAQLLLAQGAVVVVWFCAARYGHPLTVVAGAVSLPLGAVCVVVSVASSNYVPLPGVLNYRQVSDAVYLFGDTWAISVAGLGTLLLGVPWLAGLTVRFSARARSSLQSQEIAEAEAARAVHEREQAEEIARLRDDQARLARDVHDVVGHSLAVILAQAESAQYVADVDTDKLKATMATIATSARSSLKDVRQVLTSARDEQVDLQPRALDTLIDGVRASGHDVVSRELGSPQPMPPELEVAAYRVLQEMLTNAIKHGSRDEAVFVERHWPDGSWAGELRIEVRNSVTPGQALNDETRPVTAVGHSQPVDGQGLAGMQRRLEACGGRLDVRRREEESGTTFTATAWVPVRTVSP